MPLENEGSNGSAFGGEALGGNREVRIRMTFRLFEFRTVIVLRGPLLGIAVGRHRFLAAAELPRCLNFRALSPLIHLDGARNADRVGGQGKRCEQWIRGCSRDRYRSADMHQLAVIRRIDGCNFDGHDCACPLVKRPLGLHCLALVPEQHDAGKHDKDEPRDHTAKRTGNAAEP